LRTEALQTQLGFHNLISWSGLDIGRDRGSPVSHYDAPFEFTGRLLRVTIAMHSDQKLDGGGVGDAGMARQGERLGREKSDYFILS